MQPYPCTCTLLHTQISNSSTQTGPESILRFLPRLAPEPIIDDLERRYRRIIVLFLPHRGCDTLKGFCSIADTVESDTAWTSHQQAAASRQPIGFLTCQPFTFVRENLNRIRQAEELDVTLQSKGASPKNCLRSWLVAANRRCRSMLPQY